MKESTRMMQGKPNGWGVWQAVLVVLFALWWGGLTFYAGLVVPIGTELLGATDQGFITQQVTWWHNVLLTAMTMCLVIEAIRQKSKARRGSAFGLGVIAAGMAVVSAALFSEHSQLTAMMDFETQTVPEEFCSRHAIYLWLTAVEWALGLALVILEARSMSRGGDDQHVA